GRVPWSDGAFPQVGTSTVRHGRRHVPCRGAGRGGGPGAARRPRARGPGGAR
ncbi:MAG: hypothetical protein AVDCRST_MAG54-418, partial [uncultured Actinomycetospora sp.]